MTNEHFDVLIIGAGLSGIGTAVHISQECPGKRLAILERRQRVGGTWDLFSYPGIRSDSDMFSFGYDFRPWNDLNTLADGQSIRSYISETASEYGVDKLIRFGIETEQAQWCSEQQHWIVSARDLDTGLARHFSCDFLISCTGYYDHKTGYLPDFPGVEQFQGQCIHPQHWPADLDYRNKRVVVIGSGATAVTVVPAMADQAAHVTMLQRSPSYVMTVPARDKLTEVLRKIMPERWANDLARKRNILIQRWLFKAAKRWPERMRSYLLRQVAKQLDDQANMKHFTPSYMPWDQRLCAVPDGDLFKAINSGKASVVTDRIDRFTEHGIRLASGKELEADIVITATGLKLQLLGGTQLLIDDDLQGRVAAERTEYGVDFRLYQRALDAESRYCRALRLPIDQPPAGNRNASGYTSGPSGLRNCGHVGHGRTGVGLRAAGECDSAPPGSEPAMASAQCL